MEIIPKWAKCVGGAAKYRAIRSGFSLKVAAQEQIYTAQISWPRYTLFSSFRSACRNFLADLSIPLVEGTQTAAE